MSDGEQLLNPAAVISTAACVIGVVFAATSLRVSAAPRMQGARVFALSCLLGSLFASTNVALTSGSMLLSRYALRTGLLFAAFHGASWYWFTAVRQGRALYRWEKGIIAMAVVWGLLGPVPNLLYNEAVWAHEVRWAHIHYTDWHSTWLGDVAFGYFVVAMGILFLRSLRRYPQAGRIERAECIGLGILLLTGINDALASADILPMPYLLDLGFLALVVLVASALASGFVDNARALLSAQEELVRRERLSALGEMSAVVAHEVRNPVAIIFNAVSQLRKGTGEQESLLAIVQDEAERLKRMAADLLEFARPTSVAFLRVELRPVLEGAVAATLGSLEDDAAHIEVDLSECPAQLTCDDRLLRQALVNLLTNALQSRSRRGAVRFSARSARDNVVLLVSDDGEGIDKGSIDKIFTPFFTTRPTGTGLGLSVVRRIAEAHHGTLAYRPTEGGGATFELSLPLTQSDAG